MVEICNLRSRTKKFISLPFAPLLLFQSCVNIVVDFISPENAAHCIQVNDEIRLLPTRHKAKRKVMGVMIQYILASGFFIDQFWD